MPSFHMLQRFRTTSDEPRKQTLTGFLLTVIIRLWVGDSPMESFRFPSLSALGECVMLETSGRYEAIQHQAELNPAKQWKWTVR